MSALSDLWDLEPVEHFKLFVRKLDFTLKSRRHNGRKPGNKKVKPVGEDTREVYEAMFSRFVQWMTENKTKPFSKLEPKDILTFISLTKGEEKDAKDKASGDAGKNDVPENADQHILNSTIQLRYLRMLERCYLHLEIVPNPATLADHDAFANNRLKRDAGMVTLTDEEQQRFLEALPDSPMRGVRRGANTGWKRRRDRAMQVLMIGAGVRVAEAIGIHTHEVLPTPLHDGSHRIKITPPDKHKTSYKHEALMPAYAAEIVFAWMKERKAMRIPGKLLFPGNIEGEPLDPSTVYRHVQKTFERAGIDADRTGGRTLRNTYAVKELSNGTSPVEMTERLGLALERSTERYALAAGSKQ